MNEIKQKITIETVIFKSFAEVCFRRTDLDFPDDLHLLLIIGVRELVDFDFVLLDFFHDLLAAEREHRGNREGTE